MSGCNFSKNFTWEISRWHLWSNKFGDASTQFLHVASNYSRFSSIRSDFMKPIGRRIEPHFAWTRGFPLRFLAEHSAVSERILHFFLGDLRRNKREWIIAYPEAEQKALIDVGWRYRIVVTLEFYAILGEGVGIPKFWWIGSRNTRKNVNFEVQWWQRNHRIGYDWFVYSIIGSRNHHEFNKTAKFFLQQISSHPAKNRVVVFSVCLPVRQREHRPC